MSERREILDEKRHRPPAPVSGGGGIEGVIGNDLDLLEALLDAEGVAIPRARSIAKRGAKLAPLSPAQRRLWFIQELDPGSTAYTISGAFLLRGALDAAALEAALSGVIARHEALRTTFEAEEGEPRQVIHEAMPVVIEREHGDPGRPADEAARIAAELARRPWNLTAGPLVRAVLVEFGPCEHALVVALHHIVADGGSIGILLRDLGAFYGACIAGGLPGLGAPPIQYADYAAWLLERLAAGELDPQLGFWRAALAGAPLTLEVPTDRPRSAAPIRRGATIRFEIDGLVAAGLEEAARAAGATPFSALLACFEALIGRWTGKRDFVIGSPVANRTEEETASLVGVFVNTVALRADLSGNPELRDLLVRARDATRAALANAEAPFEQVVEAVGAPRTAGSTSLFQVMLAYQDAPGAALDLAGLAAVPVDVDDGTAKFDLTLSIEKRARGFACALEYDADLFDRETAERLAAQYTRIAGDLAAGGEVRVFEAGLAGDDECLPGGSSAAVAGGEVHGFEAELADDHARLPTAPLGAPPTARPAAAPAQAPGGEVRVFEAEVAGDAARLPTAVPTTVPAAAPAAAPSEGEAREKSRGAGPRGSWGARTARGPNARVAPATAVEEIVAGVWAGLLGLDAVGVTENFFDLGGHSLVATRIVARLRRVLGAELPLRALFDAPTVRGLAARVEAARRTPAPPISRAPEEERRKASYSQQRLWFLDRLEPASAAYNIANAVRALGELDVEALGRALSEIVRRHEALRTRFEDGPDGALQIIDPPAPVPIDFEDLTGIPPAERENEAKRHAGSAAREPFDLARGPVVRVRLLRLGPEDHVLVLVIHHIAADGWSMGVLVGELAAAYTACARGGVPGLPELPVQYADWSAWQRSWLEAGEMQVQLAHWRTELDGMEPLGLPIDRPRPARPTSAGASLDVRLDPDLVGRLARLARSEGATLHMTLLAAFAALLGRWSGQRDFGIGTPVANRTREEAEPLIGVFVNSLVVRARLGGARLTYRELLGRIREGALGAYANQDIPFERVVEDLQPERDLARTPLFQVMFILQNAPGGELDLGGVRLGAFEAPIETSTFDLTLSLSPALEGLDGFIEYSTELFDEATVRRFWDHLVRLLEAVASDPDVDVCRARLLGPDERDRALEDWSGRRALAVSNRLVHERFAEQAAATPDRVAAVLGDRRVTYGEIDERSDRLAGHLAGLGVGPESRVGLCVERSPELLVGMMAVLKAGGAFVPLDPDHPQSRLVLALDDAGACIVLATSASAPLVAGAGREVVRLDDERSYARREVVRLDDEQSYGRRLAQPVRRPSLSDLAYVIYTSGTTGMPKGVMVTHGALAASYTAWDRLYGLGKIRTHLQMASVASDVCTGDVVRALGSGGTLVFCERERLLDPARLFDLARRERVEFADFLPVVMRPLAVEARESGERLDAFRVAVVGADVWAAAEIEGFRSVFGPGTRFGNSYGVTEATIDSCCWFVGDGEAGAGSPPIGRPLSHTTVYVLDEALEPTPPGVIGELYLGGPAVARGYLGRPGLSAERFLPDPFGEPGARVYRTGDRARYLADGRIVFAGRSDDQVKIRGLRIEPAEIESAIVGLDGIAACAVTARRDAGDDLRLAAYVVPRDEGEIDPEAVRLHLRARIPDAMVPSAVVVLGALPLTPNGKVDRKRLPEPEWGTPFAYEPPRTAGERAVAAAFAAVMGLERVGASDDFFALGGHSLLATRVVSHLRACLGIELPLRALFEAPTVRALAVRIDAPAPAHAPLLAPAHAPPPVRRAAEGDRRRPSYAQQRLWFLDRLEPGSAAYNLPSLVHLEGELDVAALGRSVSEVVRRHEALRTRFAEGPDGPEQVIDLPAPVVLAMEDLTALSETDRTCQGERLVREEARRSFDLARGPLLRAKLLRFGPREHALLVTVHHIAADGWSLGVLVREIGALYRAYTEGRDSPLGELAVQYADWAAWQRSWLEAGDMERQLAYWRAELGGAATLALPSDRPRPARPAYAGASLALRFPLKLRERLERLARTEGATLHMTLVAGYAAALGRWSGQRDIIVGTPVANRTTAEAESLIGFFVNTLALRVRLGGRGLTFRGLLGRVRETALGAYTNQDVPFERVVEDLQPERYLGHTPVIQTLFALQNAPAGEIALPGLALAYDEPETGVTRFDLEMFLAETPAGLEGTMNYSTELFDRETVERFAENLAALLEAAALDPGRELATLPALAPVQLRRVLTEWNAAREAYHDPLLVHALFERHAALAPETVAARFGDACLTYGELNARANRLARFLRRRGAGVETLVAVCVERSLDLLVALLATMKAGAAYVPIDPRYPPGRSALILADAGAHVVLTVASLADRFVGSGARAIRLDADWEEIARQEAEDLGLDVPPDALVYSVYTSGSTGLPKGVAMSHRAISNLLSWQRRDSGRENPAPRLSEGREPLRSESKRGAPAQLDRGGPGRLDRGGPDRPDRGAPAQLDPGTPAKLDRGVPALIERGAPASPRTLQFASLSFDVSFQEIFSTLTAGGQIVLVTEEERRDAQLLIRLIAEREIERLFVPFVALGQLAETAEAGSFYPPSVREIDTAGEQLRITPAIAALCVHLPACRLMNHYGPSETHLVTTFELEGDPSRWPELPPIGRPIPNAPVYLLDDDTRPVPIGVPGELYVGGAGLARGYHARPDLTAEWFVPDPFSGEPGGRLYRTGDLARFLPGGNIEFLGRRDLQVKIRGHRVEPAEIEAVIARHPAVRQAAVAAREHRGGKRLAAYVVLDPDVRVAQGELSEHLARALPEFMIPAAIVALAALPVTPNGKVDRGALPEPEWGMPTGFVAPRTPEEEVACGIFAQVLGLERVGVADDFFDLGGHSLLATQVISRIRRAFGAEVPLRAVFEVRTPAGVAAAAWAARRTGAPVPPPIRRAPDAERRALSYAQRRLWFLDTLEPGSAVYNLPATVRLEGDLNVGALGRALSEIVRRHEALRTRFALGPNGPEQIVGAPPEARMEPEDLSGIARARIGPDDPSGIAGAPSEAEARRIVAEEAARPFDLARGPILRVRLLRLGPREHVLSLIVHHISADGWSMGVLVRELGALYEAYAGGGESPLPEPAVHYADWAAWQRTWLEGGELDRQLAYWRGELEGAPSALDLPTDRARGETASWKGSTLEVLLPAGLGTAIERFARSEGATLQMALLAAYGWTLMRQCGQREVVVGTPVANRRSAEAEDLVGFFVNTLAVRVRAGGEGLTYRELLSRVRETSLGAYANQDVPFERVVEELAPKRALNRAPLFQTAFALQNARLPRIELAGLRMTPFEVETGTAKFDLMLVLEETSEGLSGAFEFNTDLFDRASIAAIFAHFETILAGAVAAPDAPLADLPLASEVEELRILAEWSRCGSDAPDGHSHPLGASSPHECAIPGALVPGAHAAEDLTFGDFPMPGLLNEPEGSLGDPQVVGREVTPDDSSHDSPEMHPPRAAVAVPGVLPMAASLEGTALLHELFERQAKRTPDAPALAFGWESIAYGELEVRANRLANHLRSLGVGPELRVAVLLDRSFEAIVSLLAVLKAGGVYVPLEPAQPAERQRYFVEDSGAALVVSESRFAKKLAGAPALVALDRDAGAIAKRSPGRPEGGARPENLAYVIYTSGSTGRPKGVGVEHRQIASYVAAAILRLGIRPGWRFALVSTLAADLGHTSLFPALATGGSLHLLPHELAFDAAGAEAYFAEHSIDCLKIVPSHLQALSSGRSPERVMPRRLLVLGGEGTPGSRLASLRGLAPECRVAIHYGPTETTVGAIAGFPEDADAARSVAPLGRPLANSRAYVLDDLLRAVPDGVPGGLFLAGAGVARGYIGRAGLTAEQFVPDPFSAGPGTRMYRTGDRARWLRDGRVEFLGRTDAQVKVRGYRVEPGEIEAAIATHPAVREAAVVAREDPADGVRLAAYVVAEPRMSPTIGGLARRRLPNGLSVAELNRNETDYIYREIFEAGAYLRHGIRLEDHDTVFDVGANIGLFTVYANVACASPRVFAFEPNPHLLPILRANAAAYAPGATIVLAGLAEREREAEFTFFPGFSLLSGLYADAETEKRVVKSFLQNQGRAGVEGAASLAVEADTLLAERFAGRTFDVHLRTISDLIAEHGIERIDLLKVNAEKAELDVLRGIREEDWPRIDQTVIEVDVAANLAPIVALLEGHDFEVLVDRDPLLERTDLCYVYAARRGSGRALAPGAAPSALLPGFGEPFLTSGALRAHIARSLPEYMHPSAWVFLEALPLSANGKLDRGRLPEPAAQGGVYVAPRGEIERTIAQIWADALGLERVGAYDNFFDIGGHSLLLARVHARLRESLGADLPVVELFRFPTVASLAARLAGQGADRSVTNSGQERGASRRDAARTRARTGRGKGPGASHE